jgi:hypothetical protein
MQRQNSEFRILNLDNVGFRSSTQPTILLPTPHSPLPTPTISSSFEYLFFAAIRVFAAYLLLGQLLVYNLTDFGL